MKLERLMKIILEEIHSTDFAREWAKDYATAASATCKNYIRIKQPSNYGSWNSKPLSCWTRDQFGYMIYFMLYP